MNVENRGELTTHHDKKIATGASKRRWQIFFCKFQNMRVVKRGAISTFITRGAFEVFYDLPTADSHHVTHGTVP